MTSGADALSAYIFASKYSNTKSDGARETWTEAVQRVMDMHWARYQPEAGSRLDALFDVAEKSLQNKTALGSMRNMQYGGAPVLKNNLRSYNCFREDVRFIARGGVRAFSECYDGERLEVLTPSGAWKPAVVRRFGEQALNRLTIRRGKAEHVVHATATHRWIMEDGTVTDSVAEGASLKPAPDILADFVFEDAPPDEKVAWCYGMVFGDGTRCKDKSGQYRSSMIRLCGADKRFVDRFLEVGFSCSYPKSCGGDPMVYTGSYLKTPIDLKEEPRLVRAFVRGWLDADGEKNGLMYRTGGDNPFLSIQVTGQEEIEFARRALPIAGAYIVSEREIVGETNYGHRSDVTVSFRICSAFTGLTRTKTRVVHIEEAVETAPVWCLEVEDEAAFVLEFGLSTGNCSGSYCDRIRFFAEAFYLLLCGTGVGFSVQKQHVAKLPPVLGPRRDTAPITHVIDDSIEGWADAAHALINAYFAGGIDVVFDPSHVRPKGSRISSISGLAPGPEPLLIALDATRAVLESRIGLSLRPIDAYDIVMHLSCAVLSGGVRRSATIALFSVDDEEMIRAKSGNWFDVNPQRARSNNSAVLLRGSTDFETFARLVDTAQASGGEPGFSWVDSYDIVYNPCQPESATVLTPDGIRAFKDIDVGSRIWSETGWTTVVRKWSTGIKPVYRYRTTAGEFLGTENHRLVSGGEKVEAMHAESIDVLCGPIPGADTLGWQDVVDGLVIGDGTYKEDSGVLLCVGKDDAADYAALFAGEEHEPWYAGMGVWRVPTTVTQEEMPRTFERTVPERFFRGPAAKARGFLRGLYSANGSVLSKAGRVVLKTASPGLRDQVQTMLSSLGIKSYFTTNNEHPVTFDNGTYTCKESYDVNITGQSLFLFRKHIGFVHAYKNRKLEEVCRQKEGGKFRPKKTFDIISVEPQGEMEVFDITVDNDTHTYWTGGCNVSNCHEVGFYPVDEFGNSGWHFCNLSTINGAQVRDLNDFLAACEAAAILGTLQAGYTSFPYLGEVSERIARKESLLGVSITGIQDRPDPLLDPVVLSLGVRSIRETNEEVAKLIGINPAARLTAIKPEGTTSALVNAASGKHRRHSHRYIRRVQANETEIFAQVFAAMNPGHVEASVWGKGDLVLKFPIESPEGAALRGDDCALNQLAEVVLLKRAWIDPGRTAERCNHPHVQNSVSNTVTVKPDEWDAVKKFIYLHREAFAGVSLLPAGGDLDYPQAPFVSVDEPERAAERAEWERLAATLVDVDYTATGGVDAFGETVACGGGKCEIP